MTETGAMICQILSIISLMFLFFLEAIEKEFDKCNLKPLKVAALVVILIYVSNI